MTVLALLRFAYLDVMGLWIVPYAAAGMFLTLLAARKMAGWTRLPSMSFVLALFFSLSLAIDRTAVPVPTLVAAGASVVDAVQRAAHPAACQPSSEGCLPPDEGEAWIVVPFLVQWLLLCVLLAATTMAWRGIATLTGKRAGKASSS